MDEVPSATADPKVFQLAHGYVIDTYHGKLSGEDYLTDADGNSYRVVVTVNSIAQTEQDPHYGTGGDYTVNYVTGTVAFFLQPAPGAVVKVTYHYARSSLYIIKSTTGKDILLNRVEVQFGADVEVKDTVCFQVTANIPGMGRIPVATPTAYKTMMDWMNDADGNYAPMPKVGGSGWRGMAADILTLPWNYLATIQLKPSIEMQLEVRLEHDEPFGGTYAVATFYCLVEDEAE